MTVVDAGVLVSAFTDPSADGARRRAVLIEGNLHAPEVLDLEVLSALRNLVRGGVVDRPTSEKAVADLGRLPVRRAPHRPLIARCWELRENVSPYDAAYVALAELLGDTLLTTDARLARAPGLRCPVEVA